MILSKFRSELHLETSTASQNLVDLLNSSRSGSADEQEAIHQDIVHQLECQLEAMQVKCAEETQAMRAQCDADLAYQKERYEAYLREIKQCYQQEREILEEKIRRLQEECQQLGEDKSGSADNSISSEISRDAGMVTLVEQFVEVTQKYSDLKVKYNQDLRAIKDRNKELEDALKDAQSFGEKLTRKFDELASSSKSEVAKLNAKIKALEKNKTEAEDKLKELGELRKQITNLKLDMIKSESTEKKLKDAIQKKKEELCKEKSLRKKTLKQDRSATKKSLETNNKLEKDMRSVLKENNNLKEENKILKSRVSELLSKGANQTNNETTNLNAQLNSSVIVPLSNANRNFSNYLEGLRFIKLKKSSTSSFLMNKSHG